jgi:hypothetical protein
MYYTVENAEQKLLFKKSGTLLRKIEILYNGLPVHIFLNYLFRSEVCLGQDAHKLS